jgi:uncharacterized protein YkwD
MRTISSFTNRLLSAILLCFAAASLVACAADHAGESGPGGPMPGLWQGGELSFVIREGAMEELTFVEKTCGGDGCTGKAGGAVEGRHALAGIVVIDAAPAHLEGIFDTPYMASGSYTVEATNGCCKVVGAWSAEWIKALPGAASSSSGAASSSGASSSGSTSGAIGSIDWGGASTGDLQPGPRRATPKHVNDDDYSVQQNLALAELNKLRANVGVAPVKADQALSKAAQSHADFYVAHIDAYKKKGLNPHFEDKSFGAGFTGKSLGERVKAAGYSGPPGPEVMAFSGSAKGAIDGWLATVYHRLPLIDPRSAKIGYGSAKSAKARTEVMEFGRGATGKAPIVVYPWPGQTGVPKSWSGNEGPQPPKPKTGYPSGPVISARFTDGAKILDHQLIDEDGAKLDHVWLTKASDKTLASFDSKTVVMYANDPLPSGTFTVRIDVESGSTSKRLQWSFSTK